MLMIEGLLYESFVLSNRGILKMQIWNPKDYNSKNDFRYGYVDKTFKLFDFNIKGNERILDVGCGNGSIINSIAQKYPSVSITAIDISDSMLEYARENNSPPNIEYRKFNATTIDYENEFDIVVSFACLQWIKGDDQVKALNNIAEALKKEGCFIGLLYKQTVEYDALLNLSKKSKWNTYMPESVVKNLFFQDYSPDEYGELINQSELDSLETTVVKDYIYDNRESFMKVSKGWLPYLALIKEEDHDDFINDFTDEYIETAKLAGMNKFTEYYHEMLMFFAKK